LKEAGYEIGRNVRMEYRYSDNRIERLPALAAELIDIPVAVIITSGGPRVAFVAKGATFTIPIVFAPVSDPIGNGLVESLNKPGGNVTGVAALTIELDPKRLELLHEMMPSQGPLGVLVNPTRLDAEQQVSGIQAAARLVGRRLVLAGASSVEQIDAAFALFAQNSIAGLMVAADPFYSSQQTRILDLVARYGWPAIYQWREFADAGGLTSCGPSRFDAYRQVGMFVARILNGEKPSDLPVQQPTKFELVINMKTAKALGLTVPQTLLARADEIIE